MMCQLLKSLNNESDNGIIKREETIDTWWISLYD